MKRTFPPTLHLDLRLHPIHYEAELYRARVETSSKGTEPSRSSELRGRQLIV